MPFAVNGADATPDPFVATVIVLLLLLNVPDAPVEGAVNTTLAPDMGLVPASFTVTASAGRKGQIDSGSLRSRTGKRSDRSGGTRSDSSARRRLG